jgi:hypothetical protein
MESYFNGFTVEHIECNKNVEADDLVEAVARNTLMSADVFFQVLKDTSVKTILPEPRIINIIEAEDWRASIMVYPAIITSQTVKMSKPECNSERTIIK